MAFNKQAFTAKLDEYHRAWHLLKQLRKTLKQNTYIRSKPLLFIVFILAITVTTLTENATLNTHQPALPTKAKVIHNLVVKRNTK